MSNPIVTLKGKQEFDLVFKQGKSYVNRHFVLYVLPSKKDEKRIAFCAGKKLGKAVQRNRMRRRAKSAFQQLADRVKNGYSLVIIARFPVYNDGFDFLINSLFILLKRAGVLKEDIQ